MVKPARRFRRMRTPLRQFRRDENPALPPAQPRRLPRARRSHRRETRHSPRCNPCKPGRSTNAMPHPRAIWSTGSTHAAPLAWRVRAIGQDRSRQHENGCKQDVKSTTGDAIVPCGWFHHGLFGGWGPFKLPAKRRGARVAERSGCASIATGPRPIPPP